MYDIERDKYCCVIIQNDSKLACCRCIRAVKQFFKTRCSPSSSIKETIRISGSNDEHVLGFACLNDETIFVSSREEAKHLVMSADKQVAIPVIYFSFHAESIYHFNRHVFPA